MGHNHNEFQSDNLALNEVYEKTVKKSYMLEEIGVLDFEMIWIPSKVDYYRKLLNEMEAKKQDDDESLTILDNMIKSLEDPFQGYKEVSDRENPNYNANQIEDGNTNTFSPDLVYSEKIENYLLKTMGIY